MLTFIRSRFSLFVLLVACFSIAFAQVGTGPTNVVNVVATPGNGNVVELEWDPAMDQDGGVISGYKIYYGFNAVKEEGDYYDAEIEIPDQTFYTLQGLELGKTYYLAVTALDDEGNESLNFSEEVSATVGAAGAEDGTPKVISAKQTSATEVAITMSEPVTFGDPLVAFSLEDMLGTIVPVSNAIAMGSNVNLIISDGVLVSGSQYRVIASSLVQDMEGNPVASGITDSVVFTALSGVEFQECGTDGNCLVQAIEEGDEASATLSYSMNFFGEAQIRQRIQFQHLRSPNTGGFRVEETVQQTDVLSPSGLRYEDLNLGTHWNCTYGNQDSFLTYLRKVRNGSANINDVFAGYVSCEVYDRPGGTVIRTLGMTQMELDELRGVITAAQTPGGMINAPVDGGGFQSAPPLQDTTAPLDVTNLQVDSRALGQTGMVTLTWTPALDISQDIMDQVLYVREGLGAWDSGYSLGKNVGSVDLEVLENQNYQVKIVTVDSVGNQSNGALTSFSTDLSATGPEQLWFFIIGLVVAVFLFFFLAREAA